MVKPGDSLASYRVLEKIGAGGMGEVYKARDTRLDRDVAIKILSPALAGDPDALARFEREALSVAKLSHPNILAIYEFGNHDGTAYVVTELVRGETLRERLSSGPIAPRRAVAYAYQIALGMAAAHARGIVHRDLKPENVMIGQDDRVKILDFGLAKPAPISSAEDTRAMSVQTNAGTVLGTFAYMAPEQVRGLPVDHRTDIFAFGAMLYELLTGERAFKGATAADTMTAVLTRDPPDLDLARLAISPALDRIVRRCLEKAPDLRFQSANDLAFALETLSGTSTPASSHVHALPVTGGRRVWVRRAAVAVLLVTAMAAAYAAGQIAANRDDTSELARYSRMTFRRGRVTGARFAPDGQSIVYSAIWDSEAERIYPLRVDRPRAEAQPLAEAGLMAVSASGDMAVRTRSDTLGMFTMRGTLAQVPLAGGQPRLVLDRVDASDTAPDGRLAVVRHSAGRTRLEFPIGTVLFETAGWISAPRFSPDGTRIAFHEHPLHDDDRGWPAIVDLGTRAKRNLTREFATLSGLAWAPGGDEICFASSVTIQCAGVSREAVRVALRGGQRMILFDIARDGRLLVSAYTIHDRQVVGDAQGREVDLSWQDAMLPMTFSRDRTRLLFGSMDYGVYLRPIDGSAAVRLGNGIPTGLSPDDRWGSPSTRKFRHA